MIILVLVVTARIGVVAALHHQELGNYGLCMESVTPWGCWFRCCLEYLLVMRPYSWPQDVCSSLVLEDNCSATSTMCLDLVILIKIIPVHGQIDYEILNI